MTGVTANGPSEKLAAVHIATCQFGDRRTLGQIRLADSGIRLSLKESTRTTEAEPVLEL
jgi:hypothetical protein